MAVEEVVTGSATFEWLVGERFVVQHSDGDHELFPDGLSVIGPPEQGEGLLMEAHDEFEGVFELAETPGDWREDMRVTYRRRA